MGSRGLAPVGLFVVVGVSASLGCGQEGAATAAAGAAAAMSVGRPDRIEGLVDREDYVSEKATDKDPHLLNAWGLVFGPHGLGWIASNGTGKVVAYDSAGVPRREIQSPTPRGVREVPAPTGLVWNHDHDSFRGDQLIFVTEGGTVAGADRDDSEAKLRFVSDAVYKGCAIARWRGRTLLYATDFVGGKVDVFDDHYRPVKTQGGFVDKGLKKSFAPFNIMTAEGDKLIVSYALREEGGEDDVAGPGNGFVDLFDAEGRLIARLISQGALNSPWGLTFAPDEGEKRSLDLLVGNFGDGRINAYDISFQNHRLDVTFEGALGDVETGKPILLDGLWALAFGNDLGGFEADDLYFTAGPNEEADGVFGELSFVGKRR